MATTAGRIGIWNMALGFVGTRTVASETERTPEAVQCSLYYDRARRAALRDHPYGFAVRRVRLAEKVLPEVYAQEWKHGYGLPDRCLRVLRVHGGREDVPREPWALESDEDGSILLCNIEGAMATCTFDVEDVSRWDELFVNVMARRLAAFIAVPLLKSPARVQELEQLYRLAVPRAEGQDAAERSLKRPDDPWLAARAGRREEA